MTQDTTSQLIGKCGRGHVVRGTHNTFAGYSANVERGSFLRCECGAAAVIKLLDVRVVEGMLCSGKCTRAALRPARRRCAMIDSWLEEGTAHRTAVQMTPVIHLLVKEAGDWRLWCSGGKGRPDNPHGNRLCSKCRALAREAVADEMLALDGRDARWA
jgi:hypothetical protein